VIIRHIISFTLTGSLALACVGAGAAASADASTFPVYDNTFYLNVNLEQVGAVKSNVIYEAPVAQLSGQNPNSFRGPRPRGAELALPAKADYEALVQRTAGHPGPVVLDFETLYLKGSRTVAQRHFEKLSTLLDWAHEAVPGRTVGYYGVLGNTLPRYFKLERSLARSLTTAPPGAPVSATPCPRPPPSLRASPSTPTSGRSITTEPSWPGAI
jgi:hypothetical protein